jgi:pimeloyl-ACP methyl ester carboxylesterase
MNPTPDYPVGLHLASRDLAENVIYVSRPCQYSGMVAENTPCPQEYWTDRRFSLDVMQSMNMVLDKLRDRYDLRGFHLVGYSGGAAVAAMLVAKRDDVLSLRTVAGNLDHVTLNNFHHVSPMPGSLNPRDFAQDIAHIPQHHFLGAWDDIVPPGVYDSFRGAMGPSTCVRMSMVDEVNHEDGWVNRWPSLLAMPVDCDVLPTP